MQVRDGEPLDGCQLVVRVERRRVARGATGALEYSLTACGKGVELVRVGWRLQRIDVDRQRIELLVAVTRVGDRSTRWKILGGAEVAVSREKLRILIQRGVAHQIGDRSVTNQTRVIEVSPIFHADEIRHLGGVPVARPRAWLNAR